MTCFSWQGLGLAEVTQCLPNTATARLAPGSDAPVCCPCPRDSPPCSEVVLAKVRQWEETRAEQMGWYLGRERGWM